MVTPDCHHIWGWTFCTRCLRKYLYIVTFIITLWSKFSVFPKRSFLNSFWNYMHQFNTLVWFWGDELGPANFLVTKNSFWSISSRKKHSWYQPYFFSMLAIVILFFAADINFIFNIFVSSYLLKIRFIEPII